MFIDESLVSCKFCKEVATKIFKRERPNPDRRVCIPLCVRHHRLFYLIKNAGFRPTSHIARLDPLFDPTTHYVARQGNPPQPVLIPMTRAKQSYYHRRYLSKNPPLILSNDPAHPVCKWCNERKPPTEFYANRAYNSGLNPQCKDCHYLQYRLPIKLEKERMAHNNRPRVEGEGEVV